MLNGPPAFPELDKGGARTLMGALDAQETGGNICKLVHKLIRPNRRESAPGGWLPCGPGQLTPLERLRRNTAGTKDNPDNDIDTDTGRKKTQLPGVSAAACGAIAALAGRAGSVIEPLPESIGSAAVVWCLRPRRASLTVCTKPRTRVGCP